MALHECAERHFRLPHHLGVVFLDRDHGQTAVRIHGDKVGDRWTQRKAFDAAVEFLRQQQRRVQRRRHRGAVFGRNENSLHARAPHVAAEPTDFSSPGPCCRALTVILPCRWELDKLPKWPDHGYRRPLSAWKSASTMASGVDSTFTDPVKGRSMAMTGARK